MESHPAFQKSPSQITLDELRKRCNAQIQALYSNNIDVIMIIS